MHVLFSDLQKNSKTSLRDQLCEKISLQISSGNLGRGDRLPSCRKLATHLNISRNTVVSAYQNLIYDGLVESREKSGYFVHTTAKQHIRFADKITQPAVQSRLFDKIAASHSLSSNEIIERPKNWSEYPYPFVCNQMDAKRFPLANWRNCSASILSQNKSVQVISDYSYDDCDELIKEIQTRLLPSRGIYVPKEQILLTTGAQQAIYLTASIFGGDKYQVGIEDPCYPDARNIFKSLFTNIAHIPLDDEGITLNDELQKSNLIYVTPNHQYPTTYRMSKMRRQKLLKIARQNNMVIIEDDYDSRTDFDTQLSTALKADDSGDNVIYIGSLSKDISPGLRIGYIVAPKDFVQEAKKLRGMIIRHLPQVLQLTTAQFIRLGHHDAHINRLQNIYRKRWKIALNALNHYFADCEITSGTGNTNFVIKSPHKIDFSILETKALKKGVVIDSLKQCYINQADCIGLFRIGVSAIGVDKIDAGIRILRQVYDTQVAISKSV